MKETIRLEAIEVEPSDNKGSPHVHLYDFENNTYDHVTFLYIDIEYYATMLECAVHPKKL